MPIIIGGIAFSAAIIGSTCKVAWNMYTDWRNEREKKVKRVRGNAKILAAEEKACEKVRQAGKANVANTRKVSIAVLGMPSAGKTTLYCFLQGKEYKDMQTAKDDYSSFSYQKSDKSIVFISAGYDIGGDEKLIPMYKELIKKSDKIFFLFDISEYEKDPDYHSQTNSRIQHVIELKEELNKNSSLITLLTHKDLMTTSELENAFTNFKSEMFGKSYSGIVLNNKNKCDAINMTEKHELQRLIENYL